MPPANPPSPPHHYQLYVGVDIAAASFTASQMRPEAKPSKAQHYQQTGEAYVKLQRDLLRTGCQPAQILVVMEATGTYWISLAVYLEQAGFRVAVINPLQAHNYAKSLLQRNKNDQLDAQTLAKFGQSHQPAAWSPPPQVYHQLQQRLSQRAALVDLRQQVLNQLHALQVCPVIVPQVQARMQELIATFDQQIEVVETEIKQVVEQDQDWSKSITLLQTIPGIGLLTACWLVVVSLNFTGCEKGEALAHYAGLAPVVRRSGTSVYSPPQVGGGGHSQLRSLLYMAALTASQFNPVIREFYQRLKARGKAPKVARCAAARKLVLLAFAIVKSGQPFQADYRTRQSQAALENAAC